MIEIEKPRIEVEDLSSDGKFGRFVVEPLERGFGNTLGNSLRRVLLSSLEGVAVQSIKINNLEDRITLLNMNVLDIFNVYETDSFDLITCNPPYFKVNEFSNLNNNMIKSIARHEIEIKLEDICRISKKLLKNNGSLVLVHRTDRLSEIINMLLKYNLQPKRIRFLYPKEQENSNLVLIDARKNGNIGLKVLPPLICHNMDGSYTKEVLDMFRR